MALTGGSRPAAQADRVAGFLLTGLAERHRPHLGGVYTLDRDCPAANARPHYSNGVGGHIYFHPVTNRHAPVTPLSPGLRRRGGPQPTAKWLLGSTFTPNGNGSSWATYDATGAIPVGSAVWRYHEDKWCDTLPPPRPPPRPPSRLTAGGRGAGATGH